METLIVQFGTLAITLASVVLATGIVWRVEDRLDMSFKSFQLAVIIFSLAVSLEIIVNTLHITNYTPLRIYFRLLIAVCLFFGFWEMRAVLQHIDGEELPFRKKRKRR